MSEPAVTPADIAAAEHLAGVTYTEAERAIIAESIAGQIARARARRAVDLPADLPTATRFDPRLPGFAMPAGPAFAPPQVAAPDLPDDPADIAFAPVGVLGAWLRAGRLTARVLTEIYLDRIARVAPALACVATLTPALARAQAERADRLAERGQWLGPLHGIPWACKDILDTAGIATEWGAEPYRGRVPERDATVVARLHAAGAVMLGKFSVGALAYGDLWFGGRTRNPWNREEGSSGSSAGSAAAVAAGLAAFALGTETLGSIVYPCTRCGAVGLRPTFGRLPRTGAMPLCWSLDKIGPIVRSVADAALVLDALNGADPADAHQIPAPFVHDPDAPIADLRVGYYPEDYEAPGALPADAQALAALRTLPVRLVALRRPSLPYGALVNLLDAEAAASFEDLTLSDRDDELAWQEPRAWPNTFRCARFLSAVDHVQLDRLRRRVMQVMDAAFAEVDAIVAPPFGGPLSVIGNFTGHPCLVLPCGLHEQPARLPGGVTAGPARAVPHALTLLGRLFDEGTILRLGAALERHLEMAERRPPPG
jgi:Asp-tRNA(Asn)/Glu-tRNA(Gln) amidotransferase A subunit family amidase